MVDGPRLLLVEDDRALVDLLAPVLREEGYVVETAPDGQRGLHRALLGGHDVLLVDRGLPGVEGVDLVRRLRSRGVTTPALLLTARGTVRDRVEGLDAGAEDYLVKPFELDELLARLRALLRRPLAEAATLPVPGGRLDAAARSVELDDGRRVELSGREHALLELLARRPRQVFTREELLDAAFDGSDQPGSVETYVHYLRRKLGRGVVDTVYGLGYRLGRTRQDDA